MSLLAIRDASTSSFAEKTYLQGAILNAIGYGTVLAISWNCIHALLLRDRKDQRRRIVLVASVVLGFILSTIFLAACAELTQLSFVEHRDFPGGPAAYEVSDSAKGLIVVGDVAFVLANWSASAFMVSRIQPTGI